MRKIVFAEVAFCLIASVSCQQENLTPQDPKANTPIEITAVMPQTKIAFAEDGDGNLQGSWEAYSKVDDVEIEADVIFGFRGDDEVSFKVVSVDAESGVATLQQTTSVVFAEGDAVHVICAPGLNVTPNGQSYSVDFSSQTGKTAALLLSDAKVADGKLTFTFRNAYSMICVDKDVQFSSSSARKITSAIVSGHKLCSSGTVALNGEELAFTAGTPSNFIVRTTDVGSRKEDDVIKTNAPIYIAIPQGEVEKITLRASNFGYEYSVDKAVVPGKYYRIKDQKFSSVSYPTAGVTNSGVVWATSNLKTTSSVGRGYLYSWAATELIYTPDDNTAPSYKDGYSGGFVARDGENYYSSTGYTKYNDSDGLMVLQPVDDIVQLTYPGSGWRMPTDPEFAALITNSAYNMTNSSSAAVEGKVNLFRGVTYQGTSQKTGRYWSSTLSNTKANAVYYGLSSAGVLSKAESGRPGGYMIRPVKTAQ